MALNKEQLKQGIIRLQQDMLTKTDVSMEEYAERLASRNPPTSGGLYGSYYQ